MAYQDMADAVATIDVWEDPEMLRSYAQMAGIRAYKEATDAAIDEARRAALTDAALAYAREHPTCMQCGSQPTAHVTLTPEDSPNTFTGWARCTACEQARHAPPALVPA